MVTQKRFETEIEKQFPKGRFEKTPYTEQTGDRVSRLYLYYNITGDTIAEMKHIGTYNIENKDAWYFDQDNKAVHVK